MSGVGSVMGAEGLLGENLFGYLDVLHTGSGRERRTSYRDLGIGLGRAKIVN